MPRSSPASNSWPASPSDEGEHRLLGMVYLECGVWDVSSKAHLDRYRSAIACNRPGRMAAPTEIANAVGFLAGPKASVVSGAHLLCHGARIEGIHY